MSARSTEDARRLADRRVGRFVEEGEVLPCRVRYLLEKMFPSDVRVAWGEKVRTDEAT